MKRSAIGVWLVAVAVGVGCDDKGEAEDQGPPPAPLMVVELGPGPASVGPPGAPKPAVNCDGKAVEIRLNRATAQAVPIEVAVTPPGVLEVPATTIGARSKAAQLVVRGERPGQATIRVRAAGQACDLARDCPELQITVLETAGCLGCIKPNKAAREATHEAVCRRDAFYVESEWASPSLCGPDRNATPPEPGAAKRIERLLEAGPDENHPPLRQAICAWGAPECVRTCGGDAAPTLPPGYRVRAVVRPLLAGRVGPQRFFRVHYEISSRRGTRRYELPADAACDAVDRLQRAVDRIALTAAAWCPSARKNALACAPAQTPALKVGLECPLKPTQARAQSTPAQQTWAEDRMRDQSGPVSLPDPAKARIYLLDGGLHASQRQADWSAQTFAGAFPDDAQGDRLAHGPAMAGLMQPLARKIPLDSVRVFEPEGGAETGRLAQALFQVWRAIQGRKDEAALINLSLGWPAEYALPIPRKGVTRRWVDGAWSESACVTVDDGVGESVRYVLARMAALDRTGRGRVAVLAAAGNLPPQGIDLDKRALTLGGRACGEEAVISDLVLAGVLMRVPGLAAQRGPLPIWLAEADPGLLLSLRQLVQQAAASLEQNPRLDPRGAIADKLAGFRNDPAQGRAWQTIEAGLRDLAGAGGPYCDRRQGARPRPFLPAAWGLPDGGDPTGALGPLDMNLGGACVPVDLALAVGAHDARNRLRYHHTGTVVPPLAAPGVQVFGASPDLPASADLGLTACQGALTTTSAQPAPTSGTSASTALVTAVAARLQAAVSPALAARFGSPGNLASLDQTTLGAVLRHTGLPIRAEGTPAAKAPVRPSLCRAAAAVTQCGPDLAGDLQCLASGGSNCNKFRTNCNLASCSVSQAPPAFNPSFPAGDCTPSVGPLSAVETGADWSVACGGEVTCTTGYEAGVLGPQPPDPLCELCSLRVDWSSGAPRGTFVIEAGKAFPYDDYRVSNPRLMLKVPDGTGAVSKGYVTLPLGDKIYPGWMDKVSELPLETISTDQAGWVEAKGWFVADQVRVADGKRYFMFEAIDVTSPPP